MLGEILGKGLAMSLQCHYDRVVGVTQRKSCDFFGLQREFNVKTVWPRQYRARFRS